MKSIFGTIAGMSGMGLKVVAVLELIGVVLKYGVGSFAGTVDPMVGVICCLIGYGIYCLMQGLGDKGLEIGLRYNK